MAFPVSTANGQERSFSEIAAEIRRLSAEVRTRLASDPEFAATYWRYVDLAKSEAELTDPRLFAWLEGSPSEELSPEAPAHRARVRQQWRCSAAQLPPQRPGRAYLG